MRTTKLFYGIVCFLTALLLVLLALLVFSEPIGPKTLIILVLAVSAISLFGTGWFLIVRRNLPMSWKATSLIVLLFVCIGAFVVFGIPYFVKAKSHVAENACVNNLRQIEIAAEQFALEKKKNKGDPINFTDDLTPYINLPKSGKIASCPAGGTYSIKKVGDKPICSLGTTVVPPHVLP